MNPKDFHNEISNYTPPPLILIGNGINRHFAKGKSWENILKNLIAAKDPEGALSEWEAFLASDVTNAELLNLFDISDEERNKQFSNKKFIWPDRCSCKLLDSVIKKNLQILTTNFDHNIENYINKHAPHALKKCKAAGDKQIKGHKFYRWNRFYGYSDVPATKSINTSDSLRVWHIHGELDDKKSESILFSFSRYADAIGRLKKLHHPDDPDWHGTNTWIEIFFKSPLVVVGLNLGNQEIFLRYLILQRMRYHKRNEGIKAKSYYLFAQDDENTDKKQPASEKSNRYFLEKAGFELVKFKSFDDLYQVEL